jgi:Protein kinase domain.
MLQSFTYPFVDLQTEVQIMRGTNHPSIVKLISFSESPERYFLVLECMSQSLHTELN